MLKPEDISTHPGIEAASQVGTENPGTMDMYNQLGTTSQDTESDQPDRDPSVNVDSVLKVNSFCRRIAS